MSADNTKNPLPGVRRIVTGHNGDGVSVVKSDSPILSIPISEEHPGAMAGALWKTGTVPVADNNDETDGATRTADGDFGFVVRAGTNFQFTDLAPGVSAPLHRTSSLDHNILISGRLILIMEDGSETLVDTPGDLVVQRGTIHAWRNPGPEWTRWLTILIDAEPAIVNGTALPASMAS